MRTTITCINKTEFLSSCQKLAQLPRPGERRKTKLGVKVSTSFNHFQKSVLAVTEQEHADSLKERITSRRRNLDYADVAHSVANFIKQNHDKFLNELSIDDLKTERISLELYNFEEIPPEVKIEITNLIKHLNELETHQSAFDKKVSDLQKARPKLEKILKSIHDLEIEIRALEEKMNLLGEDVLRKGDHNCWRVLREFIEQKETLRKKTLSEFASSDYHKDIVATEAARKALGQPESPNYYSLQAEALQYDTERDALQTRMTTTGTRLSELETYLHGIMPRVLLRSEDSSYTAVYGLLNEVPFFKTYKADMESGNMSKTSLTDEERRADGQILFACDFSDYSSETITTYLDFRQSGSIPNREESTLLELYKLVLYHI